MDGGQHCDRVATPPEPRNPSRAPSSVPTPGCGDALWDASPCTATTFAAVSWASLPVSPPRRTLGSFLPSAPSVDGDSDSTSIGCQSYCRIRHLLGSHRWHVHQSRLKDLGGQRRSVRLEVRWRGGNPGTSRSACHRAPREGNGDPVAATGRGLAPPSDQGPLKTRRGGDLETGS